MGMRYLSDATKKELSGTALLRLDFNTEDNWRMEAVIPTIRFLLKTSLAIAIASHRGRPDGFDKKLSLKKDAVALARLLKRPVVFINNFRFAEIRRMIARAPRGSVFLLENLRFMPGEEKNDPTFARQLASLADFYVNDAFAVSHRANASITAVTKFLPSYAGMELQNEIHFLGKAMARPKHPLVLVLGGAKAADKLGVITYFKRKADWFLLGGGPGNTILSLKGMDVRDSVKDTDPKSLKALAAVADYKNILLPDDFKWHSNKILDLGPKTTKKFAAKIAAAGTVIWSGPLGLIEEKAYVTSSLHIARAIGNNRRAFSISGGGETVMFLKKYRLDKKFTFISTGGGAMVDFLAGKKLPGIEALARAAKR